MRLPILLSFLLSLTTHALAAPQVVVSIRPLHSIVASVMGDAGSPTLLLDKNASPHTATLKPSQARSLQETDLVFWVGPELEAFLKGPLKTLSRNKSVALLEKTKGLTRHDRREGAHKEEKGHDDHDGHKDEHAEHKDEHADHKDEHDEHKDEHAEHKAGHDGHDHEGTLDPHIWLDTQNAALLANEIATQLSKVDPDNANTYKVNAMAFGAQIKLLEEKIQTRLKEAKVNYFIQHDGFQYFEKRFGLSAPTVLAINPELRPGAATVKALRAKAGSAENPCLLTEPQFDAVTAQTVFEGLDVRRSEVDLMGQEFSAGPNQYFETIEAVANSFANCLKP